MNWYYPKESLLEAGNGGVSTSGPPRSYSDDQSHNPNSNVLNNATKATGYEIPNQETTREAPAPRQPPSTPPSESSCQLLHCEDWPCQTRRCSKAHYHAQTFPNEQEHQVVTGETESPATRDSSLLGWVKGSSTTKEEKLKEEKRKLKEENQKLEDVNSSLKDTVTAKTTKLTKLEKDYASVEKEKQKAETRCYNAEEEKRRLFKSEQAYKNANEQLTKSLIQERSENSKLRDERKSNSDEIAKLRRKLAEMEDEHKTDQSLVKQLRAEIHSQEAIVTKFQEAAMSKLAANVSTELSDDFIQQTFDGLFEDIRYWVTESSIPKLQETEEIKKSLIEIGLLRSDEELHPRDRFNMNSETATDTVLETVLYKELCDTFIKNQFFVAYSIGFQDEYQIDGFPKGENVRKDLVPNALKLIEVLVRSETDSRSQAWRAQTVQLLEKSSNARKYRQECYKKFAENFLGRYRQLIRESLGEEDILELVDITSRFGEFSIQLWGLQATIEVEGLSEFQSTKFEVHSPKMVAARGIGVEHGNDTRFDGRPICLVVQPMISALRQAGDKQKKRRIWAKAVVWISNQDTRE